MLFVCLLLSLSVGAARPEDGLYVVRQSYALPDDDYLSLHVDAGGANVVIRTGPAGMIEATFHVADTLHPPVFRRWEYADSGDLSTFEFARPEDGSAPARNELWEIGIPPELDFISTLHAGFTDIALWDVRDMLASVDSDSANLEMDMSSLEGGQLTLVADAARGDISLYVPKTAEVFVVAECTLGMLSAPGFTAVDLGRLAEPEVDFSYSATQQGRSWRPTEPGGAKISLLADAARGDVRIILLGE